jgi:hypothetical protein
MNSLPAHYVNKFPAHFFLYVIEVLNSLLLILYRLDNSDNLQGESFTLKKEAGYFFSEFSVNIDQLIGRFIPEDNKLHKKYNYFSIIWNRVHLERKNYWRTLTSDLNTRLFLVLNS